MFSIVSMLSEIEKKFLYEIVQTIELEEDDCILEFGVFLGGSIEPMALGLSKKKIKNKIIGVDAFRCSLDGSFRTYVEADVSKMNLEHLYLFIDKDLDWFNIANFNLSKYSNIKLIQTESRKYKHSEKNIALIHMDLPKFYIEIHEILDEILPYMKKKCVVVFQDFFYHWSAELIAFVFYLMKHKHVQYVYDASCTLAVENISLSRECIEIFKNKINDYDFMKQHLVECIEYFDTATFFTSKVSRIETLRLALIQYAKVNNDETIVTQQYDILKEKSSNHFLRLYKELESFQFDIRKLYEEDFIEQE